MHDILSVIIVICFPLISGRNWRQEYLTALSSRRLMSCITSFIVHLLCVVEVSRCAPHPSREKSIVTMATEREFTNGSLGPLAALSIS